MKVHELISFLYTLDPELEVTVSGYEGGFNVVSGVTEVREFVSGYHEPWYYGPHELLDYVLDMEHLSKEEVELRGTFKAVTLF